MQEVDINMLVDKYNYLKQKIPDNIIIVGKINELCISNKYNQLDLSRVECNKIEYCSCRNRISP